jgi:hypothetical protein
MLHYSIYFPPPVPASKVLQLQVTGRSRYTYTRRKERDVFLNSVTSSHTVTKSKSSYKVKLFILVCTYIQCIGMLKLVKRENENGKRVTSVHLSMHVHFVFVCRASHSRFYKQFLLSHFVSKSNLFFPLFQKLSLQILFTFPLSSFSRVKTLEEMRELGLANFSNNIFLPLNFNTLFSQRDGSLLVDVHCLYDGIQQGYCGLCYTYNIVSPPPHSYFFLYVLRKSNEYTYLI